MREGSRIHQDSRLDNGKAGVSHGHNEASSRISDLRRAGYKIKTEDVKVKNRDGSSSYIAKYSFLEIKA